MEKETRNAIERATQRARTVLEEDYAAELEGDFDVHRSGAVAAKAGKHLSPRQVFHREKVIAAIEHKRAAGMDAKDAVADYLRDAAFTTLNRFVALKMLEARDLVQECVTKGEQSSGYQEFCGMAPGVQLLPNGAGYRLYVESIFDELSTEVKVLFDRRDPSSVLWPRRATFEQLLEILNSTELARVWAEDETIGWVYQFFNGQDERRKMREESQAPRNSRELAVRNQFFTPRYRPRSKTRYPRLSVPKTVAGSRIKRDPAFSGAHPLIEVARTRRVPLDKAAELVAQQGGRRAQTRVHLAGRFVESGGRPGATSRVEQVVPRHAMRGRTGDLFSPPEASIRAALDRFVREEAGATNARRRLFVDDAAHGVDLLAVGEKKFDAVLMNPPFGAGSTRAKEAFEKAYPRTKSDVYAEPRRRLEMLQHPLGVWRWREEIC